MAEGEAKISGSATTNIHEPSDTGPDEQDYTDTARYAEQFIQQVARLRDKMHRS